MKKKVFAALALSATLAMGAVPAFAADDGTSVGDQTGVTTADGAAVGNTTLSVKTVATNIKATVPITMTVAGAAEGGALTTPDNYSIVNGSVYPISVQVKSSTDGITDAVWTLVDDASTLDKTNAANANKISVTLTPATAVGAITLKAADSDAWKVDAKTADADTTCAITVAGHITQTDKKAGVTSEALKLVYTIAPTSIDATPGA